MEKVLITGGTGLIGKAITNHLIALGYQVLILSRSKRPTLNQVSYFQWDVEKGIIDMEAVLQADYILHLAGENVASSRWTEKRKLEIVESRVKSTDLLYQVLSQHKHNVKSFVSASAIGFYGTQTSDKVFSEEDISGDDFLAFVCEKWENSVLQIEALGIRTVILRTGVVFGNHDSALQKMTAPFLFGFGSAIGTGKQYVPWIHIKDLCEMYLYATQKPTINGVFNAVSGDQLTNKKLSQIFALKMKKPFLMPNVPSFLLRLLFGEMAVILLEGSRISSEKIKNEGFVFQFESLEKALNDLL